jgi:hypothetical protein
VVFKGGTSLAKVFSAIRRFSEDIDLAVSPAALGFTQGELDDALYAPGADLAAAYDDLGARVVALEIVRTFWEKATILHAEYHRPAAQPMRDRFARHYADFEALWRHPSRDAALARLDLLADVVRHKSRFFASSWARYDTAAPGSFRLVPPAARLPALAQDYAAMAPMFMSAPLGFEALLERLAAAERRLNDGSVG